jgi:hypothetical protein
VNGAARQTIPSSVRVATSRPPLPWVRRVKVSVAAKERSDKPVASGMQRWYSDTQAKTLHPT